MSGQCYEDNSGSGGKRKYISVETFNKKAKRVEMKWGDLDTENVYYINAIHELPVKEGKTSKYAELWNIVSGQRTTVWLPSILATELEGCDVMKTPTYVQSLGLKENKQGTRDYFDFIVVTDEDGNSPDDPNEIGARRYMSMEQFKAKAKLIKNTVKWGDLQIGETYFIKAVRTRGTWKYAELEDIKDGAARNNVWLPNLITSVLEGHDLKIPTYIRPMGLKKNIDGTRSYHDFLIVTDDGEE